MRTCFRCLLPDTMPSVVIDESGLCETCRATPDANVLAEERKTLRAELEAAIDERRGAQPYEAVVAFSGGKDSSFALKHLVEDFGLRCLAVTIDNDFLSEDTFGNCKAVCSALGVDHEIFAPNRKFSAHMYRVSARHSNARPPVRSEYASSICASCISLINTHMMRRAFQLQAPIIAGGYLGGQVPRDRAVTLVHAGRQARARRAMLHRQVSQFGEDAAPYFHLDSGPDGERTVVIINPMLGIDLTEDEIIEALDPLGWTKPKDTGMTSTNCRLNDLGVYLHNRHYRFHPYAMEIAEQLRTGKLSKEEAKHKLATIPEREDVQWIADRLDLDLHGS